MEYINFRKTNNKNVILADNISRDEEIHVDKLEKQIADIQSQIDNIPLPIPTKDIKDERLLALAEEFNESIPSPDELEVQKQALEDILSQCTNAKESK